MALPEKLVSDELLRKAVYAGVILVLGACLLSQVMMQLGGGVRDQPLDLSDQLPDNMDDRAEGAAMFPDGLPPFISSGGVFYPEKAVFDVGLALGGILTMLLAVELFLRTGAGLKGSDGSIWRRGANVGQLVTGVVMGGSLVMLTRHPFNVELVTHLFYAMNIFYGTFIWGAFLTFSRGRLDANLTFRKGWPLSNIRWGLVLVGFISMQLMLILLANNLINGSAFFEWAMTFAVEAQILTILPILATVTQDPHPSTEMADSEE
jgi:hypothetical protein